MTDKTAVPLGGAVLTHGFLLATATWSVGYVCRLPLVNAPAWLLGILILAAIPACGYVAGRNTGRPLVALLAGLLGSFVNLLVLGALLADPEQTNAVHPTAALWVPGSLVAGAVLSFLGGVAGALRARPSPASASPGALAMTAAWATLLLVVAGGLVTGEEAGMAVPDWPSSFGANMFLYPASRMTGGVYYEHAHRLFGTLVGLTTLVLAVFLFRRETRRGVKVAGLAILLAVIAQGVLGGLRVTQDDRILATFHAAAGQAIFAAILALGAVLSPTWLDGPPPRTAPGARLDQRLAAVFAALTLLQILLGALVRQLSAVLHGHITGAVVVFLLALVVGIRLWGTNPDDAILRRTGLSIAGIVTAQMALGIAALAVAGATIGEPKRPAVDVLVTTAHQATGALILGAAALAAVWTRRRLARPA